MYFCIEIVILLLLSHVGWNGPSVTFFSCSWEKSKFVQHIIMKKFLPILDRYRVTLPLECPFHPQRDIFWWPQRDSSEMEEWTCPACGQKFHCEQLFAGHWDKTHGRSTSPAEDAVCLANFCDIMRCDVLSDLYNRNKELLGHNIEENTENRVKKENKSFQKSESCDELKLLNLQNKCKGIIRQCIIGLLTTLSLKDFQDIEDDLTNAICSYLTCEFYWEDFQDDVRHVPILFCIIIGIIVIGGFCLCYYMVWVLFESPHHPTACCNGLHVSNLMYNNHPGTYVQYGNYHKIPGKGRDVKKKSLQ